MSSVVSSRSSSCQSPDLVLPRPFPSALTTMAFDHSRRRWFGTCSCQPVPVGIELRRACCRWRVTSLALSIARWDLISTMATFPEAPQGPSHNAYISESVTIHYRWSPLWGASLTVLRRIHREGGDCVVCKSPSGSDYSLPPARTRACAASAQNVFEHILCDMCPPEICGGQRITF